VVGVGVRPELDAPAHELEDLLLHRHTMDGEG
jgi:hypothetical protein